MPGPELEPALPAAARQQHPSILRAGTQSLRRPSGRGFGHGTAPHCLPELICKARQGGGQQESPGQAAPSQPPARERLQPSTLDLTRVTFQGSLCAHSPPPAQPLERQLQSIPQSQTLTVAAFSSREALADTPGT